MGAPVLINGTRYKPASWQGFQRPPGAALRLLDMCRRAGEVLFNRAYKPIWQRWPDGLVTRANPDERVKWIQQEFYFNDGDAPFWPTWSTRRRLTAERKATKARCESVLVDWDVG